MPLGNYVTVFLSEISGILECCDIILKENHIISTHIFSDSQSSIKALNGYKFTSALVLECRDALDLLSSICPVELTWVPGHQGIEGNEKADHLARAASTTHFIGPQPVYAVSFASLKSIITRWKATTFSNYWNSLSFAKHAKNCISINGKNSRYYISLNRTNLRKLTQVLTGHCPLNKHLHAMGFITDPLCPKCGEVETAEHLLCHCPAYIKARMKHLGGFTISYNIVWSLPPYLILKFINEINRF